MSLAVILWSDSHRHLCLLAKKSTSLLAPDAVFGCNVRTPEKKNNNNEKKINRKKLTPRLAVSLWTSPVPLANVFTLVEDVSSLASGAAVCRDLHNGAHEENREKHNPISVVLLPYSFSPSSSTTSPPLALTSSADDVLGVAGRLL